MIKVNVVANVGPGRTWPCDVSGISAARYIHGIQMLPLSPALMLARSPKFNKLEWRLGEGSYWAPTIS